MILEIPKRNFPKSALDPDTTKVRETFPEKLVMKLGQRIRGAHLLKRKEKREPQQSGQQVQRSRERGKRCGEKELQATHGRWSKEPGRS